MRRGRFFDDEREGPTTTASGIADSRGDARRRDDLRLAGALLLVGFVVNGIQRMLLHPSGAEDDHEAIFTEFAESDVWVATHFAEFVFVFVAFAALLVLCRALRPETPYLSLLAAGAVIVTSATWAVLQGVDGGHTQAGGRRDDRISQFPDRYVRT